MTSPFAGDDPGVREGDVLAGKYRVDKVLGVGGMGVVVAAHHLRLDEKVAIKFLLPEALRSEEAVARFEREARAAVKIKSEHVARIIDVGALDNGAPYMVMEHLDGSDLATWVRERGPLDVEQAVEFVLQACEALAEAHALGIIHRDLKPANLLCIRGRDGLLSVKVLDFGISKLTGPGASDSDLGMTKTQSMMGSPMYMSPEQMRSAKDVDPRADIWSLGIILFELLAGHTPFSAESMPHLVLKIMTEPPPDLSEARPDLPAGLGEVILRCLEKDRTRRYPNVAELASALAEFGPDRSIASVQRVSRVIQTAGMSATALAMPSPASSISEPAPGSGTVAPWWRATPTGGSKKTALAAILAVATVLLGVGAFIVFTNDGRSQPTPGGPELSAAVALPATESSSHPNPEPEPEPEPEPASASGSASASPSASAASAPSASASATVAAPRRLPKKPQPPAGPSTSPAVPPAYDPLDHL